MSQAARSLRNRTVFVIGLTILIGVVPQLKSTHAQSAVVSANGQPWDVNDVFGRDDGSIATGGQSAYKNWGYLVVRVLDEDRSVLVPDQVLSGFGLTSDMGRGWSTTTPRIPGGVSVTRSLFSPKGTDYMRYVDGFVNTAANTRIVLVYWGGDSATVPGSVTNNDILYASSSSGPSIGLSDTWIVTSLGFFPTGNPRNFNGPPSGYAFRRPSDTTFMGRAFPSPPDLVHSPWVFAYRLTLKPGQLASLSYFLYRGIADQRTGPLGQSPPSNGAEEGRITSIMSQFISAPQFDDLTAAQRLNVVNWRENLSVGDVQRPAGATVFVPVNISSGLGISALQFTLGFDPTLLAPASTGTVTLGSAVPTGFTVTQRAESGRITVVVSPPVSTPVPSLLADGGIVANVAFQVAAGAMTGASSNLTASNVAASGPGGLSLPVTSTNGTFRVGGAFKGDVNEDGLVNVQDLVRLIQHLTAEKRLGTTAIPSGDINGDGIINTQDLTLLIRLITGDSISSSTLEMSIDPSSRILFPGEASSSGDVISVPIELSEGRRICAAQLSIEYDPTRIRFRENEPVQLGDLSSAGFQIYAHEDQPGRIKLLVFAPLETPIPTLDQGLGTLALLRFTSLDGRHTARVKVKNVVLSDPRGNRLPVIVLPQGGSLRTRPMVGW